MTLFVLIALGLTVGVVTWMVLPLIRPQKTESVSGVELNASIYRDHLASLERDFANGQLEAAELESARNELQRRLLEDTADETLAAPTPVNRSKPTALVIALIVPVGAALGYLWLGTPAAIDPQATQRANQEQIQKMVAGLAAKQEANPDNLQGWAMLGRSYKVLGRMEDAAKAYAKAGSFIEGNAELLVEYADVLALSLESNLQGKPTELLAKALTLDPKNPMALLMMGVSAYQREDYKLAIALWEKLLQDLEPDSEDAKQVEGNIAQAKQRLAEKPVGKPVKKP